MADFQYTPISYVNTTTPAINATNLNANDGMVDKLADEANLNHGWRLHPILQHSVLRNMQMIDLMRGRDLTDWTGSGTVTLSNDYTVPYGACGLKLLETDNSSGTIRADKTISSANLEFYYESENDQADVATNDYITMIFYISDVTLIDTPTLRLGTDSSNYYYFTGSGGAYTTGWNFISARKDYFNTVGSPDWSDVTYISVSFNSNANASGEYGIWGIVTLGRRDASFYGVNPMYSFDGDANLVEKWVYAGVASLTFFDYSIGKYGWQIMENATSSFNEIYCTRNSFALKAETYSKSDLYGVEVIWYVDSSNYVKIGAYNETFRIEETVAGTPTTIASENVFYTFARNERMFLEITKDGDLIRAVLHQDGGQTMYIEADTSLTSETGCIGFTKTHEDQNYFITDFVVGNNEGDIPSNFGIAETTFVTKLEDESRASTTTVADDAELTIKLPPNSLWEIKVYILCYAESGTPDLKFSYNYTPTSSTTQMYKYHDGRIIDYLPPTLTNYLDTTVRRNTYAFGTNIAMGAYNAGEIPAMETILVTTFNEGAILTLQWAQNTSSTDASTVKRGSYMLAKRIG